jgi:hypothetical protein
MRERLRSRMQARTLRTAAGLMAGVLWAAPAGFSASLAKLSGSIVGFVTDPAGIPQMGASVLLYNRYDRPLQRVLTTENGLFSFDSLLPDTYAIRVTLASFLPALKRNIVVQPGMQSLLNVNMASLFSSIQLVYMAPGQRALMNDEWKWVLRSSSATRPVLRFVPGVNISAPTARESSSSSVFSDTRGLVRVSAGDQGRVSFLGNEPDLGTAFALATSVFGQNQVHVSGNVGYSSYSGVPTAAIQTSFRRELPGGMSPQVRVTMRQLFLPARVGVGVLSGQGGVPALRTLSAAVLDRAQLTGSLRLEYGGSLDSVTFLDRLNYFSPYARLTYDGGDLGVLQFSYASGAPPAELFTGAGETEAELQQDLAALALFPRVSLRAGTARVQRTESFEAGYRKSVGSRTYSVAAYREKVNNAAVTVTSPAPLPSSPDLLPDLFSESWVFNAGRYQGLGYMASVTQNLGENFDLTMAYGSGEALTADRAARRTGSPNDLHDLIQTDRRYSLTARVAGTVPQTGSQFVTSYQWSNLRSLTPAHMFLTQRVREGLGLNLLVRQPIPYFSGLPGRLEATADMRNLLAQGYVPLDSGGGRVYLMHTPRSLRGGLSFIF